MLCAPEVKPFSFSTAAKLCACENLEDSSSASAAHLGGCGQSVWPLGFLSKDLPVNFRSSIISSNSEGRSSILSSCESTVGLGFDLGERENDEGVRGGTGGPTRGETAPEGDAGTAVV